MTALKCPLSDRSARHHVHVMSVVSVVRSIGGVGVRIDLRIAAHVRVVPASATGGGGAQVPRCCRRRRRWGKCGGRDSPLDGLDLRVRTDLHVRRAEEHCTRVASRHGHHGRVHHVLDEGARHDEIDTKL